MAAYDNVSLPGAPAAPSYAAPLLNFAPLGELPKAYFEGTQQGRTLALQNAFKGGLPQNADGTIDVAAMAQTLAKLGGTEQAMPLIQLAAGQQFGNSAANLIQNPTQQGSTQLPAPGPRNTSSTGEAAGADAPFTITSMAIKAGLNPDSPQGRADIDRIAKATGFDPDQSITDQSKKDMIARYAAAATAPGRKVAQAGQVSGSDTPMVPRAVQTQTITPENNLPANYTEQEAAKQRQAATNLRTAAARAAGFGRKEVADQLEKEAAARDAMATKIDDALAKRGELTLEQKNAAASGERSPISFEAQKAVQAANIKHSEALEGGIQSLGNSSATMLDNIRLQKSIVNNPEFYSGTAQDRILFLKRAVPSLAGSAAPMELYQKVLNANMLHLIDNMKAASQEMGATSSRIFGAQIGQIEKASGTLDNSVEGLRALAEINERGLTRNIQLADFATAYKQGDFRNLPPEFIKNGPPKQPGILDANFERGMRDWLAKNPILSAAELADPKSLGRIANQQPKGPPVGTEQGGYKFKGGDPKDKSNWVPIKQELRM